MEDMSCPSVSSMENSVLRTIIFDGASVLFHIISIFLYVLIKVSKVSLLFLKIGLVNNCLKILLSAIEEKKPMASNEIECFRTIFNEFISATRKNIYRMQSIFNVYEVENFKAVPPDEDSVQIIPYFPDFYDDYKGVMGHVIVARYSATEKKVIISNSHPKSDDSPMKRRILDILYPNAQVVYVQPAMMQQDEISCGLYAMTFSMWLMYGKLPEEVQLMDYDDDDDVFRENVEHNVCNFAEETLNALSHTLTKIGLV